MISSLTLRGWHGSRSGIRGLANALIRHPSSPAPAEPHVLHSGTLESSQNQDRLIAIKDNICISDQPTTCASGILHGFHSPFSATVVERLASAGWKVIGKTNLDEFGMGFVCLNDIDALLADPSEDRTLYTQCLVL